MVIPPKYGSNRFWRISIWNPSPFGTGNPKFDAPLLQGPRCSVSGFEMKPTPRMAAMALKNSDRCHSSWPDDEDVNRRDFMRSLRKNGSEDRDFLMGFDGILWDFMGFYGILMGFYCVRIGCSRMLVVQNSNLMWFSCACFWFSMVSKLGYEQPKRLLQFVNRDIGD